MPDAPPSTPIEPFRPLPDPSWRERAELLRERVRGWGRLAQTATAIAAAIVVAVVAFIVLRPAGADSAPDDQLPRASAAPATNVASTAAPAVVVVQAAGAVAQPGLFRLPSGARVDDLVRAAGGLTADADPDRVNLAAPLSDGQKVYIPRQGEPIPADASNADGATTASSQPIDLNTASIAELDSLPGVGPATAQAIVDYRSQHGHFRSVDDLLNVRGIGPAKLDEIRGLVRV